MIKQIWKGLSAVLNVLLEPEEEVTEEEARATKLAEELQHTREAVLSFIYEQWTASYDDDGNTKLLLQWADMVRFLDIDLHQLLTALAEAERVADEKFDICMKVEETCGPYSEVTSLAADERAAAEEETDACWNECDQYIRALVDED